MKITAALLLILVFGGFLWASDRITVQGERTIYTVRCADGHWQGLHCTGRLAAGERYTFRASRSRQEVLYWVVGSAQPSGKFSDCNVKDRGNWTCNAAADQPKAITREMRRDVPVMAADAQLQESRAVPKWQWWAIRQGLATFTDASF